MSSVLGRSSSRRTWTSTGKETFCAPLRCAKLYLTIDCHCPFYSCSVNSDGLSPLDVAVLIGNKPMAKILVAFGAQEGNQCELHGLKIGFDIVYFHFMQLCIRV